MSHRLLTHVTPNGGLPALLLDMAIYRQVARYLLTHLDVSFVLRTDKQLLGSTGTYCGRESCKYPGTCVVFLDPFPRGVPFRK
jgi:hypothetical protein